MFLFYMSDVVCAENQEKRTSTLVPGIKKSFRGMINVSMLYVHSTICITMLLSVYEMNL